MLRIKATILCFTAAFIATIGTNHALAERRQNFGPAPATETWPGSSYIVTDDSNVVSTPKVTHFRINSGGSYLKFFSMQITWDPATLALASFGEGSFSRDSVHFELFSQRQGPGYVILTYHPLDSVLLLGYENLVDFTWLTPCQAQGTTTVLNIDLNSQNNIFTDGVQTYRLESSATGHVKVGSIGDEYVPGDFNVDSRVSMTDIIYLVGYLFGSAAPSLTVVECTDLNGDCTTSTADLIYFVNYMFKSGAAPHAPCSQ